MINGFPTEEQMHALLAAGLAACDAPAQQRIRELFVPLNSIALRWEYGANEEFPAWVFADLQERSVQAAFCLGGHGALGSPWGLIFRGDDSFGMDCGWFRSLRELFEDWGIGGSGV